ncbi:PhzF family phenazine biosynthesis protein [Ramlibacter sp. H39-3-26]|uniref:PhzF family phenazine biosynthesis protein n=1 Tax=Curvibacter soli TaxID=3031331 RepID=UPI0023DAF9A3|nr:PhzF family phenazine biosynthesis protein [Ramlibacter sp. H39-3-26]MDF1485815.1 PhzF family phenazine biosynthesis protein [Ramlibacter sp. H39-3-26]
MPAPRPFKQVDVFTRRAGWGNPLAVVLDGTGLDDAAMLRFAHWTNLSETTFVLPPTQPGADYRVRIFTPGGELPFAGHPTLGTCHAWLEAGGQPRQPGAIVQECGVGLVRIRHGAGGQEPRLAFAAPPLARENPSPTLLARVAQALGLKAGQVRAAQNLTNGPTWLGLLVDSAQTVLACAPDFIALKNLGVNVGLAHVDAAAAATDSIASGEPAVTVRAFVPLIGVPEDPVTGSLNASLAQWLIADGLAPARYLAAQGHCLGRAGRVAIERDADGQVWVGGAVVTCIDGSAMLETRGA